MEQNVDYLVKEANKRMRLLHAASKFIKDKRILTQLYYTHIRCRLEQSAVLWHSSLTIRNITDLERVQKAAVRIIIGHGYDSYTQILKLLKIETLFERREKLCLRFAIKSLKVDNFSDLLPKHEKFHKMCTRDQNKFELTQTYSKKYKMSTIPYLQRILNKHVKNQKMIFKKCRNSIKLVTS